MYLHRRVARMVTFDEQEWSRARERGYPRFVLLVQRADPPVPRDERAGDGDRAYRLTAKVSHGPGDTTALAAVCRFHRTAALYPSRTAVPRDPAVADGNP